MEGAAGNSVFPRQRQAVEIGLRPVSQLARANRSRRGRTSVRLAVITAALYRQRLASDRGWFGTGTRYFLPQWAERISNPGGHRFPAIFIAGSVGVKQHR